MPTTAIALLTTIAMCSWKLRFWSKITPKSQWEATTGTGLFKMAYGCLRGLFLREKVINADFEGLICRSHVEHQSEMKLIAD
jgi:hypothetical protein